MKELKFGKGRGLHKIYYYIDAFVLDDSHSPLSEKLKLKVSRGQVR